MRPHACHMHATRRALVDDHLLAGWSAASISSSNVPPVPTADILIRFLPVGHAGAFFTVCFLLQCPQPQPVRASSQLQQFIRLLVEELLAYVY